MPDVDAVGRQPTRDLLDDPLRTCVDTMLDPCGVYQSVRDAAGIIVDFEILYVNDAACDSLNVTRSRQVGASLCEAFPAIRDTGYFEIYRQVAETGVSYEERNVERGRRYLDLRASRLGDGVIATWRDVSGRRTLEVRARTHAEELEAVLDATPAAVWIASDVECRDIRGSRLASDILRMPPRANLSLTPPDGETVPAHFVVRANGVEVPPEQLPVQRAARGDYIRGFEEELVFSNGESVWLYGNAVPLLEPDGAPRGAIAAFVDITDRKRVEQELRDALQAKDQFLATVSHELRTPLTAVLGYTQMLQNGSIPIDRQPAALETIRRNATLQLHLIDELLDLASFSRNKASMEQEPVAVDQVVAGVLDAVQPAADDKGVTIERSLASEAIVAGDARRLQQVFNNVLANALKFTPAGGRIRGSVALEPTQVTVTITDTGIGIPAEFLPHIFEPFSQADVAPSRRHGGLGLGLNIAAFIVSGHGGTITAESEGPDKGSTFRIRLPRASTSGPQPAPR